MERMEVRSHFPNLSSHAAHFGLSASAQQELRHYLDQKTNFSFYDRPFDHAMQLAGEAGTLLPDTLAADLERFVDEGNAEGYFHLRGLPCKSAAVRDTEMGERGHCFEEILLLALARMTGHPFGYANQNQDRVVQHLFPNPAHAGLQLGTGSGTFLDWHSEDAFHPYTCDFILLLCLRGNPDAATLVTRVDPEALFPNARFELQQRSYLIASDEAFENTPIVQEQQVLRYDANGRLHVRFDPLFTRFRTIDAEIAFQELHYHVMHSYRQVTLQTGELIIIDNRCTAHSRTAFQAEFGGLDRFLFRVRTRIDPPPAQVRAADAPYMVNWPGPTVGEAAPQP